jgi:hypothetical protein
MLDESACTPVAETRAFFNKFLGMNFRNPTFGGFAESQPGVIVSLTIG